MKIYNAKIHYTLVREIDQDSLDTPEIVTNYLKGAFDEDPTVEWFITIALNRKNKPLGRFVITKGTANSSLVHPREVFRPAIIESASAIIVAHNHPSGDPEPSRADREITKSLGEAGRILGIDLLDHIIIGNKLDDPQHIGYYSFQEAGLI